MYLRCCLLVQDDGSTPDLRAGAGCGRDRHHRADAVLIGARPPVAHVLEIPDRPRLPDLERDRLAGIERTPAPQRHHPVVAARTEGGDAGLHVAIDGIGLEIGEEGGLGPGGGEEIHGALDHGKGGKAGVGDEERTCYPCCRTGPGQLLEPTRPEAHGRRIAPIGSRAKGSLGHRRRSPTKCSRCRRGSFETRPLGPRLRTRTDLRVAEKPDLILRSERLEERTDPGPRCVEEPHITRARNSAPAPSR